VQSCDQASAPCLQASPFGHAENALRLGFASLDVDEIRQATQRLAQAWSAIGKTRSL
jgi:GntR family transcriptional regulator/MocR family aminotransferase